MNIERIDLNNEEHRGALIALMNDYMMDPMGASPKTVQTTFDEPFSGSSKYDTGVGFGTENIRLILPISSDEYVFASSVALASYKRH